MKTTLLTLLLFLPVTATATQWEYKVFYFSASSGKPGEVVKLESGAYVDNFKTKMLNDLGDKGWEIVAVTGLSDAHHALYMKREKTNPR